MSATIRLSDPARWIAALLVVSAVGAVPGTPPVADAQENDEPRYFYSGRTGRRESWPGVVAKRGEIVTRFRIDWLDAGNGHNAGSGTWKVIRGTGAYANLTGAGRSAHVWLPRGPAASRAEGFMRSG